MHLKFLFYTCLNRVNYWSFTSIKKPPSTKLSRKVKEFWYPSQFPSQQNLEKLISKKNKSSLAIPSLGVSVVVCTLSLAEVSLADDAPSVVFTLTGFGVIVTGVAGPGISETEETADVAVWADTADVVVLKDTAVGVVVPTSAFISLTF